MMVKSTDREWCGYVRVSKVMGREGETYVTKSQQEAKIRAALRAQFGEDCEPVRIFTDEDKTGTDDNRPEFQAMIEWVQQDPTRRGIAVMDGSRLFRNVELFLKTVKKLERDGAAYLSAHLLLDSKTPEGSLMQTMDAAINEFFSKNIGRRWQMVLEDRAKKGKHPTGRQIYGYNKVKDPEDPKGEAWMLVPDDGGTAEVVRRMFRLYNGGTGLREIANILNEEDLPSPGGSTWGISTVSRTLDNPAYVGTVMFKGEALDVEARWEPLISQATWDTFQSERERRKKLPKKAQAPKWTLGGGFAVCGLCGSPLTVNSLASPKGLVLCSNYRGGRGCSGVFMLRYKFDITYTGMLANWLDELGKYATADHDAETARIQEEANAAIRTGEDRLQAIQAARTRLAKQNAEGLITDADLKASLSDYQAEAAQVREQVAQARVRLDAATPLGDAYQRLMTDFSMPEGYEVDEDGNANMKHDEEARVAELVVKVEAGASADGARAWMQAMRTVIRRVELHDDRIVFIPVTGENDETKWRVVERDERPSRRRKPTAKRMERDVDAEAAV